MYTKLLTALFTFLIISFGQGKGQPGNLTEVQRRANHILWDLVQTHPDQKMRDEFNRLMKTKTVFLSYQTDRMPPEMAAEIVLIGGTHKPVLVINPEFLIRPKYQNKMEDKAYKQLVIIHEYTHIENHLSGTIALQFAPFKEADAHGRAMNVWKSEWFAVVAEWKLAKQIRARHLVPYIQRNVQKYGEQRGFLEGFYQAIMHNGSEISRGAHLFRPVWKQIYLQELKKMSK